MIKITVTGNFTEEEVLDFATHELGYTPAEGLEEEAIDNEIAGVVQNALTQHVVSFFQTYKARKIQEITAPYAAQVTDATAQAKAALDAREETAIEVSVEQA